MFKVHTFFNSSKAQVIENGCLLFVYDHLITYCKLAVRILFREERRRVLELKLDKNWTFGFRWGSGGLVQIRIM